MAIPEVSQILSQIKSIHEKKNADYATKGKDFENFERAGELASWFSNPTDKAFAVLVGVKLARLGVLRSGKEGPQNESIADTFLDLTTYCALWAAYNLYQEFPKRTGTEPIIHSSRDLHPSAGPEPQKKESDLPNSTRGRL